MELKELKERIEYYKGYNFWCDGILCDNCLFFNDFEINCEGKKEDYNWKLIKELDLPDNTVVTKELLKDFKIDNSQTLDFTSTSPLPGKI